MASTHPPNQANPPHNTVTILSTHSLHGSRTPASPASPYYPGPLDYLVSPGIPIAVVFIYSPQSSRRIIDTSRLQRALHRLLDYYPHLTGRLNIDASTGKRQISRFEAGARLLLAESAEGLSELTGRSSGRVTGGRLTLADLPGEGNALLPFPPVDASIGLNTDVNVPLFSIQHTRFTDGGVALGVCVSHSVCDAEGFFMLVRDLAELYRGLESGRGECDLKHPPHVDAYVPEEQQKDTPMEPPECEAAQFFLAPKTSEQTEAGDEPGDSIADVAEIPKVPTAAEDDEMPATSTADSPSDPIIGRVLHFSAEELAALKTKATGRTPDAWVSTFEALAAHLAQRIYQARVRSREQQGLPKPPSSDFLTPLNWRGPSRLDLPGRYFSNALICAVTTLPPDLLEHGSLAQVAAALHDLVRSCKPKHAEQIVQWIAAQTEPARIEQRFDYGPGSLMLSQWSSIEMYADMDFDADENGNVQLPLLVAPPFTHISLMDGLGYVLPAQPTRAGDGGVDGEPRGVDVHLALAKSVWNCLVV